MPFFVYLTFSNLGDTDGNTGLTLSMIATVVANVSGLMNGGLHLCFRANIISTIAPRDKLAEYERQQLKHKIRKADPEYDFSSVVLQPVSAPKSLPRMDSEETLVKRYEKEEENSNNGLSIYGHSPKPLRLNGVFPPITIPRAPEPAELPTATPTTGFAKRRPSTSYSLFPNNNSGNTASITILPPTTYSPTENNAKQFDESNFALKPPPSIKARHLRNSSMASSATVQIGLRFSNVADMPPMASTIVKNAEQVHNLDCPKALRPSPLTSFTPANESASPLEPSSPTTGSPRDPMKDLRMKTLPPVPRQVTLVHTKPALNGEDNEITTLSSAVYSPDSPTKKVPSPKGVGFQFPPPKRTNTTPVQSLSRSPPPSARSRGNSDAAQSRSDWI